MVQQAQQPLLQLPRQPAGVGWPTDDWPQSPLPVGVDLDAVLDSLFDDAGPGARTLAVVVVHRGSLVAERYAPDVDASTPLISWSMAKSFLHAAIGILVRDGRLDLEQPPHVPEWQEPGDPRAAVGMEDLLTMRDGLAFVEDYVDAGVSDVIEMLFGSGRDDVAHFAADRPLAYPPGTHFSYSSGTTNILAGIAGRAIDGEWPKWLERELFSPIGMRSATATADAAGTWVASSFVHATARDFAKFGYLYLRDGEWDGRRVLPAGWVDHGRRPRSFDAENGTYYGGHWWVDGSDQSVFSARGYEGQRIIVAPALDLVLVRLGKTPAERYPDVDERLRRIVDAFRAPLANAAGAKER